MSEREEVKQFAFDFEQPEKGRQPPAEEKMVEVVRLEKAFSWQQSYNRYPHYLAQANFRRTYTYEEVFTIVFHESAERVKHSKDVPSWLRNIFGLKVEPDAGEVTIAGIGLLEQVSDGRYALTDEAIEIGRTFAQDRAGKRWMKVFASVLAHNDVRTRCVLLYMGRHGCYLSFLTEPTAHNFFGDRVRYPAVLVSPTGEHHAILGEGREQGHPYSFTPTLQSVAYDTLGPFLRAKLKAQGLTVSRAMRFSGGKAGTRVHKEPSSNGLETYLKQTLSIFKDLGVIVYLPGRQAWGINYEQAQAIFPADIVADLFTALRDDPFLEYLQEVYEKLADAEGLASVRQMRDWVCDLLGVPVGERVSYFNDRVAHYMSPEQGKLGITQEFHAQASPEDCLFYDLNKEYVAFMF